MALHPVNVDRLLPLARAVRSAGSLPEAAHAALALARPLAEDLRALFELDQRAPNDALLLRVLALPLELSAAGEAELALSVARAFLFAARPELSGDIAIILARAGRRAEALAQLDSTLSAASEPYVAEVKAGDTYRALGEPDAAEAYYRRAWAIAGNDSDRGEAVLRITSFLLDSGREAEANAFLKAQGKTPSL
jgi:tetratricopeptide (TPR) repeat protein